MTAVLIWLSGLSTSTRTLRGSGKNPLTSSMRAASFGWNLYGKLEPPLLFPIADRAFRRTDFPCDFPDRHTLFEHTPHPFSDIGSETRDFDGARIVVIVRFAFLAFFIAFIVFLVIVRF